MNFQSGAHRSPYRTLKNHPIWQKNEEKLNKLVFRNTLLMFTKTLGPEILYQGFSSFFDLGI